MRGIVYFLFDIEKPSGACSLMKTYAKVFRDAGIQLDLCYLHSNSDIRYPHKVVDEIFDRVFVPPRRLTQCAEIYDRIDQVFTDPCLPEMRVTGSKLFAGSQVIASGQYDFAAIHYTPCHPIVEMLPSDLPLILHTHDLDSMVRIQEGNICGNRDGYTLEDECERIRKFDLVTVVGPTDFKTLNQIDSKLPLVEANYCPQVFLESKEIRNELKHLLFVGQNIPFKRLSLEWLWKFVWPILQENGFEGCLNIVGEISDFAIEMGFDQCPNVKIHGRVDSLEPCMDKADIMVSPYYYGAGIKISVLDAVSSGVPVITSSSGVINTHFKHGYDILVSDNGAEFADLIMKAKSKEIRQQLSTNALKTLKEHHLPSKALKGMLEKTLELVNTRVDDPFEGLEFTSFLHKELMVRLPKVIGELVAEGVEKIAIYGAGTHTRVLLETWESLRPAIQIEAVTVTEIAQKVEFQGYPVIPIAQVNSRSIDAILASSQVYEIPMAINARQLLPELNFYTIWNSSSEIEAAVQSRLNSKGCFSDELKETIP